MSSCSGDQKIEQPSKKKKILTSKRLVNSINAALDEVNYDQMRLIDNDVTHTGYLGSAKKLTLREFIGLKTNNLQVRAVVWFTVPLD